MTDGGTLSFCDASSSTIPTITPPSFSLLTVGNPVSLNGLLIDSAVLDGAGNLWFVTSGSFATGTATGITTFNGTINFSTWLGEISPSGAVLSPFNAGANTYGYQPTGLGMNVSANVTGQQAFFSVNSDAGLLGVDNAGNIWATDTYTRRVFKIPGLASANAVNY
jgi:streptogramin lyase